MLKICQVMHTRSTSQKKMLEATASAKCWRSWNGKEKLQVHVSTLVLTCTYTSSYHSQLVMIHVQKGQYIDWKSKGGWDTGFNFKGVGLHTVLERENILWFLPFCLAKTWFYIWQPFSCYNVFNITIKLFRFKTANWNEQTC